MSCADCQKRMHLSLDAGEENDTPVYRGDEVATYRSDSEVTPRQPADRHVTPYRCEVAYPVFDPAMPITTAYMNMMRNKRNESPTSESRVFSRDDCVTPEVGSR